MHQGGGQRDQDTQRVNLAGRVRHDDHADKTHGDCSPAIGTDGFLQENHAEYRDE